MNKIFVVEDDRFYGSLLKHHLELNPDNEVVLFEHAGDCLKRLQEKPMAITLDYSLPGISGSEALKAIKRIDPDIPVIMISGQEDVKTAINLLKDGAYDYLLKDDDTKDRLWNAMINIGKRKELETRVEHLEQEVEQKFQFDKSIIGNSPVLQDVFRLLNKAVKAPITVSITGETGTGKEVAAKAIHFNSNRKKKPFVPVNMAAIPSELIESELFGYEKGAFTGANARKIGKFEEANGGTIFLDEIAEMPLPMQSKLLRVLQEEEVTRLGGNGTVKIDVRIICATHRNLAEEVEKGKFREDLYYRLLGLPIELPPLRDRDNDILILAKYFLDAFSKKNKMGALKLDKMAQDKLMSYPFPGNIRELKALIELAAVMTDDNIIREEDITFRSKDGVGDMMLKERSMKDYSRMIVEHFLKKYHNDIKKVAAVLDIGVSSIYRMIQQGEIESK
ncbi:MAG: sigma-54 dependent transcriptional regulator [Flavobacteriales bacterium]|nr:sigma-54 dependent transcriptional regulator [Flavobacteriales bacterium]